jgi:hypothetical protein
MLPLPLLLLACASSGLVGPIDPAEPQTSPGDATPAGADADAPAIRVDCEGGGDFDRLSDAVEAAQDGDEIAVAPCTYEETLDFRGKTLRVVATDGPETTILAPRGTAAGILAENGEGTGTLVEGFTVDGGGGGSYAAVHADFSSLRLVDVVVTGGRGFVSVYGKSADLALERVEISGNSPSYGTDLYASKGAVVATELDLRCDDARVGAFLGHGSAMFDRSTVSCPRGTSMDWEHAVGRIQRSTLSGDVVILHEDDHFDDTVHLTNTVLDGSLSSTYGTLDVRNSIVTGGIALSLVYLDTVVEGSAVLDARCGITSDSAELTVRNNLFHGNSANACGSLDDPAGSSGNLEADPEFRDPDAGDWRLGASSPGIDAGPDDDGYEDVDGSRNDVGVYGGPYSIGGGW